MDTDKSIIIDGCNVAECEFAVKPINDNRIKCHCAKGLLQLAKMQEQPESIKSGLCENNPDCYFKQLQRVKAEKQDLINYFHLREGGMLDDIQYWKNKAQELYKELK